MPIPKNTPGAGGHCLFESGFMGKREPAGVPRGIANDRMTAEAEMAGGIDGIIDAAG